MTNLQEEEKKEKENKLKKKKEILSVSFWDLVPHKTQRYASNSRLVN